MPLVKDGTIPVANVDNDVSRMLTVVFESGLFDHPHTGGTPIDTAPQRAWARKAADERIVLLKNEGNLPPFNPASVQSIAVIGPDPAVARAGGGDSGQVCQGRVAPLDGIRKRGGAMQVNYALGAAMTGKEKSPETPETRKQVLDEAVAAAEKSDVTVVFVGYSSTHLATACRTPPFR